MHSVKNNPLISNHNTQDKEKRLGQFFTGSNLARLLAALAKPPGVTTAIDPMCGTGDMLKATLELFPKANLSGIEIDGGVLREAKSQLKNIPASKVSLIEGNSFDLKNIKKLSSRNFDLVITNPPYVRYQSLGTTNELGGTIPTASKIRQNLIEISEFLLKDVEDRRLFRTLIEDYSGLSDLAVPSWILSAMLTREGGTLALVLPESWLSRDYARIIQYLLLRWFKIRYVVEDANAAWFSSAQVKTTLLVAERVSRRSSAFVWGNECYAHIQISGDAVTENSIIGNIYPGVALCEKKFAKEVATLLAEEKQTETPLWSLEIVRVAEIADNLRSAVAQDRWLTKCERLNEDSQGIMVPIKLRRWLEGDITGLQSLEDIGVLVGQGLRTGANSFFYVDCIKEIGSQAVVVPHGNINLGTVKIPTRYLLPVLRKQTELPEGYILKKKDLSGRVLVLDDSKISGDLKKLVSIAEKTKIGTTLIPDLSAVKTNIRKASSWYVLPSMAPRHTPMLLIPRINGKIPRVYKNDSGLIVDANFSTIWLKKNSVITPFALLALLNSDWCIANMELTGAVMGGGALKIEATHIKRISIPVLKKAQIDNLDSLGRELVQSADSLTLQRINKVVVGGLFNKSSISGKLNELQKIAQQRFGERKKRA